MMLKTRDDYRFILAPWEHRGANFDARPDLVATAEVGGDKREFLLKAKRNILFFREADKGDDFLCALSAPLTQSVLPETELRAWMQQNAEFVRDLWRDELEGERYARVFLDYDIHQFLTGMALVFLASDGRGWLRESWDESGIDFQWNSPSLVPSPLMDWPSGDFPLGRDIMQKDGRIELRFRRREMPEEAIERRPLEWLCGSLNELEQFMRWITHSEAELWQTHSPCELVFTCENDYQRASLNFLKQDGQGQNLSPRLQSLSNLALDFNTPVGIGWEFCDGSSGKPRIRGSWDPCEPIARIHIEAPSFHEQLEARLELRAWLQGKASAEQIEDWLQT